MYAWLNVYNRKFLIDNDLFFKVGILFEDQQWTPRVFLKAKKVKYIDYLFYYYIIRKGSITQGENKKEIGLEIIKTCYELERIYEQLDDLELKRLLNDYLCTSFLYAVDVGDLYSEKYKGIYDKRFLIGKPMNIKVKIKSYLFILNKRAYKHLFRLYTKMREKLKSYDS